MPTLEWGEGRKLAYREEGSGPPLVLVHGSPGDSRSWGRVVPQLKDRFRVLSVDLPGYGSSDRVPDAPAGRAALMGAAVARLIDACGPVVLAGHSYGGLVAVQAALQVRAGSVSRLIVLEPMLMRGLELVDDATRGPVQAHFDDYVRRVDGGEAGAVRYMIDYWFGEGAYARMPEQVRGYLDANAPRNVLDVRSSFGDTMTREQFASLLMPVLMVYGDRSPEVVPAMGRALLKLVPRARLEVIAGGNHGMLDAHPQAVAGLIAG
jgi:pimeloyl-ACP methyl ester carboxylesterase